LKIENQESLDKFWYDNAAELMKTVEYDGIGEQTLENANILMSTQKIV